MMSDPDVEKDLALLVVVFVNLDAMLKVADEVVAFDVFLATSWAQRRENLFMLNVLYTVFVILLPKWTKAM